MILYPFNHECSWLGPVKLWASNDTDPTPPDQVQPVYVCGICGVQKSAESNDIRGEKR